MSSVAAAPALEEFIDAVCPPIERNRVRTAGLASFEIDGDRPDIALWPATLDEVARILSEADEARLAVVPLGGTSHAALGNIPEGYDVALSTTRLDAVLEHEPADMTVSVQAGVTLASLQRLLAGHGQTLPVDAPSTDASTVGGLISSNAQGPLRHAFGTVRDWLIGTTVVHADGTVSKSGGRVVKNVAGYDMHKLYVGSLGTLGVVTEATFKLAPTPRVDQTLVARFDSPGDAGRAAHQAHDRSLAVHSLELLSPAAAQHALQIPLWCLLVRSAGLPGAVDRSIRDLNTIVLEHRGKLDSVDAICWSAWAAMFLDPPLALRASVLPSQVAAVLEVMDRSFAGAAARASATVSAGLIRLRLEPTREERGPALIQRARDIVARFGGSVIVEAAPVSVKHAADVFGELRSDFAIMRRLKQECDPRRTLSPGRFVGRL